MNISEAARRTGLPAKTIRYYEDIGLVTAPRDPNGYRAFTETETNKLGFLARARALGFTIEDCRDLLALWEDKSRASADVKAIAEEHLHEIEEKIESLQDMHATLSQLVHACAGDSRPDCPILKEFAKEG
ncbi:Cu(I)-responsive transcriptional regulator [Algicella marina]|uniref:Cu(I)-responsive transcriptional regulator n=1 Tax=Algicella marina TaxID=2683284 RepID=A0A6P1T3R1_9RHOB|nr:Cu(I)-responsive transcriptional regulator [Algicella marina]QHQ36350.1 Cu(I)-responsive transcriptional regulator [Algicella marina]